MKIEISTDAGAILRPITLKLSSPIGNQIESLPNTPFKYYTDAIIGLCFHQMSDFKFVQPHEKLFAENAYKALNPYTELYRKSAPRVQAIMKPSLEKKSSG